jgi:cell wall-associated NlpC family hydrolase
MKKYLLLFSILFFSSCQDIGDNKPLLTQSKKKQPIYIVNPNRHLNIAEFWITELENPDEIIMNYKDIQKFNDDIAYQQKLYNNFKEIKPLYNSAWIKNKILKNFNALKERVKYLSDNTPIPFDFYKEIRKELNIKGVKGKNQQVRYAMTINYSNQKIIPTQEAMLKKKNQIYFDRNQNSALDIATPIAILHTSKSGAWHYGIGPTSSGWIRDQDIAFGERKEILDYIESKKFVVTTASKTPLLIKGLYHDYFRMGVKLPYVLTVDDMMMVQIPIRNSENGKLMFANATVKSSNVHIGYLKYTQKNILTQAFKFLHQPYGWGGMFGEQDCSKFIQEIYATTGLHLPRNSASQSRVGYAKVDLKNMDKIARVQALNSSAKPAVSILHLKGHIVLYIGEHNGEPFIIHTVWGNSSRHFALGRTAVTSLNFNNYLEKIDRITNIIGN